MKAIGSVGRVFSTLFAKVVRRRSSWDGLADVIDHCRKDAAERTAALI